MRVLQTDTSPTRDPRPSSLDGAGGDSIDNMLLHEQKEEHDRDRGDNKPSHDKIPLLVVLTVKIHLAERNRDGLCKDQVGEQKVVPNPKSVQNGDSGQDGLKHGQDDGKEQTDGAAAVYHGGLLQFLRHAVHEALY